ncbi:hypothetical protein EGR_05053 [Echinococcus granulosus]|uniref:Uncharacterized protein n=1 Tax=Echinococcus granulosus TaxID=6210 RepID=W6UF62_ECHGR|nr:hypothetical protein EGR_05053 [Echinococcus granulosus]EUB60055.1 hypothetical protein EGR_05053 [Echinococcus granulosus]
MESKKKSYSLQVFFPVHYRWQRETKPPRRSRKIVYPDGLCLFSPPDGIQLNGERGGVFILVTTLSNHWSKVKKNSPLKHAFSMATANLQSPNLQGDSHSDKRENIKDSNVYNFPKELTSSRECNHFDYKMKGVELHNLNDSVILHTFIYNSKMGKWLSYFRIMLPFIWPESITKFSLRCPRQNAQAQLRAGTQLLSCSTTFRKQKGNNQEGKSALLYGYLAILGSMKSTITFKPLKTVGGVFEFRFKKQTAFYLFP